MGPPRFRDKSDDCNVLSARVYAPEEVPLGILLRQWGSKKKLELWHYQIAC